MLLSLREGEGYEDLCDPAAAFSGTAAGRAEGKKQKDLLEYGVITAEQAKTHPQRNIITRAVGTDSQVEADYFNFELSIGDVLLLCSDGLSNTISDEEMLEAAKQHREPEDLCRALMELALSRGARDNVTVLAVK